MVILSKQHKYVRKIINNKIPRDFIDLIQAANIYFISKQIKSLIKGLSYVKEELNNEDINEIKKQQLFILFLGVNIIFLSTQGVDFLRI